MLNLVNGVCLFLKGQSLVKYYTVEGSDKPYIALTFSAKVFLGGQSSNVLLQVRGDSNIRKLGEIFHSMEKTRVINGLSYTGHLASYSLPLSNEVLFTYDNATKHLEENTQFSGSGPTTTIIVLDNFEGIPVLSKNATANLYNGLTSLDMNSVFITGLIGLDKSISSDGNYLFGKNKSNSTTDKTRNSLSIAGSVKTGNDIAKLRVEMHGEQRINTFDSITNNNNNIFANGMLIAYNDKIPYLIHYGIWIQQYMSFNIGNTEDIDYSKLGELIINGEVSPLVNLDKTTEELYEASGHGLIHDSEDFDSDEPF